MISKYCILRKCCSETNLRHCDINLKYVSMQENEVTFEYDKHKIFELNSNLKHNVVTFFLL